MENSISLLLLSLALSIFLSCEKEIFGDCSVAGGEVVSRTVVLPTITKIDMSIPGDVIITEGAEQEIRIEAPDAVIDKVLADSKISNSNWDIKIKRCSGIDDVTIFITMAKIEAAVINGIASIRTEGVFKNINDLHLETNGDGDIDFQLDTIQKLTMEISGLGTMRASGKAETQHIEISGSGNIQSLDLITNECKIDVSGSAQCDVHVLDELDIDFSGTGVICYRGRPTINQDVSGSGSVRSCN